MTACGDTDRCPGAAGSLFLGGGEEVSMINSVYVRLDISMSVHRMNIHQQRLL